jgi:hypothetical protein
VTDSTYKDWGILFLNDHAERIQLNGLKEMLQTVASSFPLWISSNLNHMTQPTHKPSTERINLHNKGLHDSYFLLPLLEELYQEIQSEKQDLDGNGKTMLAGNEFWYCQLDELIQGWIQ